MLLIIPKYQDVQAVQADIASYNASLATATKLKQSRDVLVSKYNSISKADLDNVQKLLPDSVNNIKLIIQIDSLATKNGLTSLSSVDYNSDTTSAAASADASAGASGKKGSSYGEFTMTFSTSGQYKNFLSFLSDIEQNLRIVDITSISFSGASVSGGQGQQDPMASKLSYKVTIKTYWLK